MTAHHLDRAIEALARRQHGTFSRSQARDLGASSGFVKRRVASGSWLVLAPGVYALPGNPPTFERQCMAAVVAERVAAVSGRTAAVLHGLDGFRPGRIEITVPSGGNHVNPFAVVRRTDAFVSVRVAGMPCGTVEQTLCDLAPRLAPDRLADTLDLALAHKQTSVRAVCARLDALPVGVRRRSRVLVDLLAARGALAYVPPGNVLEAALYRVLDDPALPPAVRQAPFPWRASRASRADALIPEWQLFVEADGRAWHTRVADFPNDLRRDREALRHGFRTARYTYDELTCEPQRVLAELVEIGSTCAA